MYDAWRYQAMEQIDGINVFSSSITIGPLDTRMLTRWEVTRWEVDDFLLSVSRQSSSNLREDYIFD